MQDKVNDAAASEQVEDTGTVDQAIEQPVHQVPLAALEAERHKRQEAESKRNELQAEIDRLKSTDDDDLVYKKDLKQFGDKLSNEDFVRMKREIAEETFKESNPEAIRQINNSLKEILDKKPWLAKSIEDAPNRYSRAFEIVNDYAPLIASKKSNANDAARIVENAKKPGSPVTMAKSAQLSSADAMKAMQGKKEFNEYRKSIRQG